MASAFLPGADIVLGQAAVDGKSDEIPAMAALLEFLDVKVAVATADATHAQRNTVQLINGKGRHFVLATKPARDRSTRTRRSGRKIPRR